MLTAIAAWLILLVILGLLGVVAPRLAGILIFTPFWLAMTAFAVLLYLPAMSVARLTRRP